MPKKGKNKSQKNNFLVVGLGASAGGIDPLKKFFKSLPAETGMAFIVVLHLSSDKDSNLTEILQRETSLDVLQVEGRTPIKKDHVYVIPPSKLLSVKNSHLELSEPEKKHGSDTIDLLFRTLARKKKKYAAGIIFSDTGNDGVTGMKIIKEEGGITIAQRPEDSRYNSMPANAIQTGAVDKVLSVKEIANELQEYRKTLYQVQLAEEAEVLSKEDKTEKILLKIFDRISSRNGHDFSNYRRSSILRRIDRRMRVNRVHTLPEYLDFIDDYPDEIDLLYDDLLITVTYFFRDPRAFEVLEKEVIPKLFKDKNSHDHVRIWIPGCASGEEAYSIAMLLHEYGSGLENPPDIQIFASDVNLDSIDKARTGRYPKSIENDLSKERLRKFFKKNGEEYSVTEELRNLVLFASHDLLRNPPFSRLDLISCRNLFIYLNRDLQTEIIKFFHYALKPNGWLFLGKSDSRLGIENLFRPVSKEFRIYEQKANVTSRVPLPDMPLLYKREPIPGINRSKTSQNKSIERLHSNILARLYAPQSILISRKYEVIHATDKINKYLQYSGGEPSRNILDMINPELRHDLRNMLFQLKNQEHLPVQRKVKISVNDQPEIVELMIHQVNDKDFPDGLIHIVFKEVEMNSKVLDPKPKKSDTDSPVEDSDIIQTLQEELAHSREQLQLSIEEYETSNDELRASNEELQSMNEELQSTTEELETSQEELQSVNEELKTLNEQLESKLDELSRAHSDLQNLMEATEIGIIFVDRNLCVQRFTSTATNIFNLIPSDEGRPLEHITHSLDYENLLEDISQVLESLNKIKKAVITKNDRWYVMRIRPYHSSKDEIEGVVLSFTEFTELREARQTIKEQQFQESLATLGIYALEQKDIEMIMHRTIQISCSLLDLECAAVMMYDEEKNIFNMASETGFGCEELEVENNEKWDIGYTLTSKEPVTVFNYTKEERFEISPFMRDSDFISSVHITIRGAEKMFGVFAVYSQQERQFSQQDLYFIQVVANILGRSMEQKMFQDELLKTNRKLEKEIKRTRQVKREMINTNVHERWELGSYLHDNFGQSLASVKILAGDIKYKISKNKEEDVTEDLEEINAIMDNCIAGIRNIIHDIVPVDVEQEGVAQAFRIVMQQTYSMHDVKCLLENDEILNQIKNREVATHLYYIVQEAVKNAANHGKADLIVISPRKENDQFVLTIKDNGVGLSASKNGKGKGIRIMQYRMDLLGGTLKIEDYSDEKQSGTVVICRLPFEKLKKTREGE